MVKIALNLAMQSEQRTQNMSFQIEKLAEEYKRTRSSKKGETV